VYRKIRALVFLLFIETDPYTHLQQTVNRKAANERNVMPSAVPMS
jgi:hypothetical protein